MAADLSAPIFSTRAGLVTLGPELVGLRTLLEAEFLRWAGECGARPMLFPPLMRVEDLDRFDYFRNFPQLPLMVAGIRSECLHDVSARGVPLQAIPAGDLATAVYTLPSAACYNIYLHFEKTVLDGPLYVTTVAHCFRNEQRYDDLRRLWGFTMREIVCLGTHDEVQAHLVRFKKRVLGFGERLGLELSVETGSDPFYQPQSPRARMQQVFPQKEEFLYDGSVAIASVNFHRNFFGERCAISTPDGEAAFTGCVAFGIERWLHALLDRFGQDPAAAAAAVADGGFDA
jgi:seryl-tRNA synthetase